MMRAGRNCSTSLTSSYVVIERMTSYPSAFRRRPNRSRMDWSSLTTRMREDMGGSFLKRASDAHHPVGRGIKPTHAPSHNGEDRHVPLYKRRTADKWGTEQNNFQQQTHPQQRCWCPGLLQ